MLVVFHERGHRPCAAVGNNAVHGTGINILAKSKFEKHVLPIMCVKVGGVMCSYRHITARIMSGSRGLDVSGLEINLVLLLLRCGMRMGRKMR